MNKTTIFIFYALVLLHNTNQCCEKNAVAYVEHYTAIRNQLFDSIENNNPQTLKKIILNNSLLLNVLDKKYGTPLFAAVRKERIECIKILLELNANPNITKISSKYAPLHIAVKKHMVKVTRILLAKGANPEQFHEEGTPFEIACRTHSPTAEEFELYGYLFYSCLWPNSNINTILEDNGKVLHEIAKTPIGSQEWHFARIALLKLLDTITVTANNPTPNKKSAIYSTKEGFILINPSDALCNNFFGAKTFSNAKQYIQDRVNIHDWLGSCIKENKLSTLNDLLKKYTISPLLQYHMLKSCIEKNALIVYNYVLLLTLSLTLPIKN